MRPCAGLTIRLGNRTYMSKPASFARLAFVEIEAHTNATATRKFTHPGIIPLSPFGRGRLQFGVACGNVLLLGLLGQWFRQFGLPLRVLDLGLCQRLGPWRQGMKHLPAKGNFIEHIVEAPFGVVEQLRHCGPGRAIGVEDL